MSDLTPQRLFTVDQANALVPELKDIFEAVRAERALLDGILPDIRAAAKNAHLGGGSVHGPRYVAALERIAGLLGRVTEMGVLVKDVDTGLCDFLFDRGGDLVLLCWRYGEPEVAWWHGLDDGFQGRRDIEELTQEA
ncbi:MAG: DUF2203 domain-containing protein [Nitrospirae bacterium]|nr:DUF2203 domain-containing protein [Nitrospirota bacterium]